MGGSYGTYLAHRFLQLYPDAVDGVTLEAIAGNQQNGIEFDDWRSAAGERLLQACAGDAFCASKLPDPLATLDALFTKLDGGHCGALGVDAYVAKYLMTYLAFYHPLNTAIPSFIYRLDRCSLADQQAIVAMYDNVFGGNGDLIGTTDRSFSSVMSQNVQLSELFWDEAFDGVDLEGWFAEQNDRTRFGFEGGPTMLASYAVWPRYDEPLSGSLFAETTTPMLMLQGGVDVATPDEQAALYATQFSAPGQHWAYFPAGAHNLLGGTPVDDAGNHCAMNMFLEFLAAPSEAPSDCLADVFPLDFAGYPALNDYVYGTADLWENSTVAGSAVGKAALPDELARAGRALRRALRASGRQVFDRTKKRHPNDHSGHADARLRRPPSLGERKDEPRVGARGRQPSGFDQRSLVE